MAVYDGVGETQFAYGAWESAPTWHNAGTRTGQKHYARTSNGVMWKAVWTADNIAFFTSTDEGLNWTWIGAQSQIFDGQVWGSPQFSFVIDDDDYLHLVYQRYTGSPDARTTRGVITYRRATLTAGKDNISSWTAQQELTSSDYWANPDIVAFKMPGTSVTWIHITYGYNWSGDNRQILMYDRMKWDGGTFSRDALNASLHDVTGAGITHPFSSITFRHNGNAKTPQLVGGVAKPDVWITYQLGYRQYVINIPYNTTSNTWPSHTIEEIDASYSNYGGTTGATNYFQKETHRWVNIHYDPRDARVIVVGNLINSALSDQRVLLYERAADNPGAGNWGKWNTEFPLFCGQSALFSDGTIGMIGKTNDNGGWLGYYAIHRTDPDRKLIRRSHFRATAHSHVQVQVDPNPRGPYWCFAFNYHDSDPTFVHKGWLNYSDTYVWDGTSQKQRRKVVLDGTEWKYRRVSTF